MSEELAMWVGLVAIATTICFWDDVAAAESGKENDGLHLAEPKPDELRRLWERVSPNALSNGCKDSSSSGSRSGLFLPIPGAALLLVGELDPQNMGKKIDIKKIEQIYQVMSSAKGGSPLEGQLTIRLQPSRIHEEQACLERLQGAPIKWAALRGSDTEETVEMVVQAIRFPPAGRVGPSGETIPTGEILAVLTLSEGWMSMAYRKIKENIWAIAAGMIGSVLLLLLKLVVGWPVRHLWRAILRTDIEAWRSTAMQKRLTWRGLFGGGKAE